MKNKYVDFIDDKQFLANVEYLYNAYVDANKSISVEKLYSNKLDVFKLSFDKAFENLSDEELINREISRQIDKTVTNAIGTFHEMMLGSINGYQRGNLSGWDIKALDNSLFADIKNKHNTMNSGAAEALYQKLQHLAEENPNAKCYWVQVISTDSFNTQWTGKLNGKIYNHPRVFRISGDKFYALLSGRDNALFEIYQALPTAIQDVITAKGCTQTSCNTALQTIQQDAARHGRSLLNQIASDNLSYYSGFDSL